MKWLWWVVIAAGVLAVLNFVFGITPSEVGTGLRTMFGSVWDFIRSLLNMDTAPG